MCFTVDMQRSEGSTVDFVLFTEDSVVHRVKHRQSCLWGKCLHSRIHLASPSFKISDRQEKKVIKVKNNSSKKSILKLQKSPTLLNKFLLFIKIDWRFLTFFTGSVEAGHKAEYYNLPSAFTTRSF